MTGCEGGATWRMAGRRRKWLIAAALLVIVAALALWISSLRRAPMLKLVFVGYTNLHPAFLTARVLATNASDEPLEPGKLYNPNDVVETSGPSPLPPGFASPWPMDWPTIVKPREVIVLNVGLFKGGEPWWTEIAARPMQRAPWLHKFSAKLGNRTVQRCVDRLFPPPQTMSFKLGPVTNLPPDMEWILDSARQQRPRRRSPSLIDGGTFR